MAKPQVSLLSKVNQPASSRFILEGLERTNHPGPGFPGLKKRGQPHANHSWIRIDQNGDSTVLELDKATVMRRCSLPARDLRQWNPEVAKSFELYEFKQAWKFDRLSQYIIETPSIIFARNSRSSV
ncbi:hypothetical protein POM88_011314 [Heracleum sosnowskyi]|uniref:Uncharacterized protein n=1 Tax=Heracleum sosnowskyi TaxID=360622 RepID=A0AAD8IW08_9APIA|nr:hypothetical protein POM88_011314 [Heracleum sosnowskyi]